MRSSQPDGSTRRVINPAFGRSSGAVFFVGMGLLFLHNDFHERIFESATLAWEVGRRSSAGSELGASD
jgi:hypothetical protein